MNQPGPHPDPESDGLYRAIMLVLIGSILLGAILTLSGEAVFDSKPLANAGLGMAVLAGIAYWGLRLKARAAQRKAERQQDRREPDRQDGA